MQKICTKYAINMLEHAYYMPLFAINMQSYEPKLHEICKYADCNSQICKDLHEICQKYAGNMQIYAKNMQVYLNNMQGVCKKHANI